MAVYTEAMDDSLPTPVAVVGASGYSGAELLRLLISHPACDLVAITSRQYAGQTLESQFPRFRGSRFAQRTFIEPSVDSLSQSGAACVFLALPHGVAAEFAGPLVDAGLRVIDLSADFRLRSAETYREFYGADHPEPERLPGAVYGMPELYAAAIRDAQLVASPGCYPTSIILPLVPLLRDALIETEGIVAASMSGVSGAGRKADTSLLFVECNESVRAYGLPKHRHLSEIEQELSLAAGSRVTIQFLPHLVPVTAGICSTITARLTNGASAEAVESSLARAYGTAPFVRLLGQRVCADTKNVVGTNFLDLGSHLDARTRRIVLTSAEDNLGKGAASQAIQSFNLMFDHEPAAGLMNF